MMNMQDTPLVLWQQMCKHALQVFALMTFMYMFTMPMVHGSAFINAPSVPGHASAAADPMAAVAVGTRNLPQVLLARSNAGTRNTPEPSPARSKYKAGPRQYNRESFKQACEKRRQTKSVDETAKEKAKTTSQNCPFGGVGFEDAKEKKSIFSFPNQEYMSVKDRKMSK